MRHDPGRPGPMLARLARELPSGDFLYEPKWDGFRCLASRDAARVDLRSRNDRPLARYFPELVDALLGVPADRFLVDGEIVAFGERGFDFGALLSRLHPAASRVDLLRTETPALFVAFDLLMLGESNLMERPFRERRSRLEGLMASAGSPLFVTPATADPATAAAWLDRFHGAGIDGVVAKHRDLTYQPGKRAMIKVKRERTADCVVGGFRWALDRPVVASLLLGLYDAAGGLRAVGVSSSFSAGVRRRLVEELGPFVTDLKEHPWRAGFGLDPSPVGRLAGSAGRWTPEMIHDWVPVRPELVCEVAYGQVDGDRFRFPARFVRWRPDRDPASCTYEQLATDGADARGILTGRGASTVGGRTAGSEPLSASR